MDSERDGSIALLASAYRFGVTKAKFAEKKSSTFVSTRSSSIYLMSACCLKPGLTLGAVGGLVAYVDGAQSRRRTGTRCPSTGTCTATLAGRALSRRNTTA